VQKLLRTILLCKVKPIVDFFKLIFRISILLGEQKKREREKKTSFKPWNVFKPFYEIPLSVSPQT
jgi:hypothetical protein